MKLKYKIFWFLFPVFFIASSCTFSKKISAEQKCNTSNKAISFNLSGTYKIALNTKGNFIVKKQELNSNALVLTLLADSKTLNLELSPPPAFSPIIVGQKIKLSAILGSSALSGNRKSLTLSDTKGHILSYVLNSGVAGIRGFSVKVVSNYSCKFPNAQAVYSYKGKELGRSFAGNSVSIIIEGQKYSLRTQQSILRAKISERLVAEGLPYNFSYILLRSK